jgi:imidazoleglycerol phosphate dehydratase HisB
MIGLDTATARCMVDFSDRIGLVLASARQAIRASRHFYHEQ